MDDAMDCLMSFSDFLFAFQIQFYYSGESSGAPRGPRETTSPSPTLPPLPSVGLAHTLLSHASAGGVLHCGSLSGCLDLVTGNHKIQSPEPTPSASSRHGKPQRF